MSFNCCSGNFSSCSLGGFVRCPGSFSPSNLVYSTDLCYPSTYQVGSSLYSGYQENCCEPSSCQTSCAVSSPCQTSCYRPRTVVLSSPCQTTYTGCPDFDSSSRYSLGCGSRSFRPLGYGVCGFPSLGCRSGFFHPIYSGSRTCQSSCYRPICGSSFY
ncbi:keratin-associated protein 13-1-like [Dasypus novemcinctus]|uniref:keratin-associated protein 13-1-like n=1 Tax=Dasypus novemcinctus TaxID=9361 RepID=UPI0003289E3B|nr:keratin-associated protein 13-1-like [Dasypus novemcinctus]